MTLFRKIIFLFLVSFFTPVSTWACTSLLAAKGATTDKSTMITYAADSHVLYGELYHQPAAVHKTGTMRNVVEWDTRKPLGVIPEVAQTYNVVGNMNEYQLAISESTWGGRAELEDTTGIMDYGSLIYIALQRAKTAREAIEVMTTLVQKHGYYSSGESFSIADPNEVWIMELIGKGKWEKGAVWVAIRIPDDCIAAHANQARIHQIPLNDKKNCLYAKDVISFARERGYYTGKDKDFSFAEAYAPLDFGALRACEARVWSFYNMFCDNMASYLPYINGESKTPLPLYIKPNRKLTVQDMQKAMRDHFDGTPFDMHNDIGGGFFKSPYRFRPMSFTVDSVNYFHERAISTQQTGFSFVAQMRSYLPNMIGGILWFGVDDANTAVYVPMYASINEIPHSYAVGNGDMLHFSWDAAFWIFNWVANMGYNKYEPLIADIRPIQVELETSFAQRQPQIEQKALALYATNPNEAQRYLNHYTIEQANFTVARWKELGQYLMVKHLDGNRKKEKNGVFLENGYGMPASPDFPGYGDAYYRSLVKETGDQFKVK